MAKSNPKILSALDLARESWEAYTIEQVKDLVIILKQSENAIIQELAKLTKDDVLKYARLSVLHKRIRAELKIANKYMEDLILKGRAYSVGRALRDAATVLKAFEALHDFTGGVGFTQTAWNQINKSALDHLIRYRPWGYSLSQDIWNVTWQAQRQLFHRLGQAIVTGESISKIIPDISKILGTGEGALDVIAGKGIYRSTYKNATRLLRTELNRAYIEGQMRYVRAKEFIAGTIHRTGSGAPCPDCEDLAGTFYPRDESSEIPVHPHCMCYLEYVLKD